MIATTGWQEPDVAESRRRSSVAIAKTALQCAEVDMPVARDVLRHLLNMLTHATSHGRTGTRYVSSAAAQALPGALLHHEHVMPRRWMIDQMMANPTDEVIEFVIRSAIACTVTEEEHKRLSRYDRTALVGWERYAAAGVAVIDRTTGVVVQTEVQEF